MKSKKYPKLHLYIHVTHPVDSSKNPEYLKTGRPNLKVIFDRVEAAVNPKDDNLRAAVVACGPESMVNETWDEASNRTCGTHRFDFHHETVSWYVMIRADTCFSLSFEFEIVFERCFD